MYSLLTGHSKFSLNKTDLTAAIWAAFWLVVLTSGNPDLLDAVVGLLQRIAG